MEVDTSPADTGRPCFCWAARVRGCVHPPCSSGAAFQMYPEGRQDSPGAGLGISALAASQGRLCAVRPPAHGAVGKRSDVQPRCQRLECLRGALLSVSPPLLCLRWLWSTTSPLCGHGEEYAGSGRGAVSHPLPSWPCPPAAPTGVGRHRNRAPREELVARSLAV